MTGDRALIKPGSIRELIQQRISMERSGQSVGSLGPTLKQALQNLRKQEDETPTSANGFSRFYTDYLDEIIRTLYSAGKSVNPEAAKAVSIIALGGYGRREMAPFSDIDLLFLHGSRHQETARPLIEFILYPLWDSGLKVGYAVHTPASAIRFAQTDYTARTAYLDRRHITGQDTIYLEFARRYDAMRHTSIKAFIRAKLRELDLRHTVSDESRFLVEPDLKNGKGGLRDIQTILWIDHYESGHQPGDKERPSGLLDPSDLKTLTQARRFYATLRHHLHMIEQRDENRLRFDVQPRLATRLQFESRDGMLGAERMMSRYFQSATEVGRILRIFSARLEQKRLKRAPTNSGKLPATLRKDPLGNASNLKLHHGRLDFANPARLAQNPIDLFRLIYAYARQDKLDIHPRAITRLTESLPFIDHAARQNPDIAILFQRALLDSPSPGRTLHLMIETGILQKYLPPFGRLTNRIVYGLYRRYTLDEQAVHTVSFLHDLSIGTHKSDHPLCTEIIRNTSNLYPLYISALLHEAIHTVRDLDKDTCFQRMIPHMRRLGLNPDDAFDTSWTIANRMLLLDAVERRNLTDKRSIELISRQIGTLRRLNLLLVVSVCHLRAVHQHMWEERYARRFRQFYHAAKLYLQQGEAALDAYFNTQYQTYRDEIANRLTGWKKKEIARLFERLGPQLSPFVDTDLWARFLPVMRSAEKDRLPAAALMRPMNDETIEAILFGNDRPGLLTALAATITNFPVSIRSVQALTTSDGKAIDILILQPSQAGSITDTNLISKLHQALLTTMTSGLGLAPRTNRQLGDRRALFHVDPEVNLDPEASQHHLIVETIGLDRPGLLHDLTKALTSLDFAIQSAYISTYGERAIDTFYIQDMDGGKPTHSRRLSRMRQTLLDVLDHSDNT